MSTTVEVVAAQSGVAPEPEPARARGHSAQLVAALFAIWFFWGSTFAAIRYAVATIPPFVMASTRFVLAGAVLWAICAVMGRARPTVGDWRRACVTGLTLLLMGNGVTSWCVQYVPTGLGSLLLSTSPVWMALFDFAVTRERPARSTVAGMILGCAGLVLLLQPKAAGALPLVPTVLLIAASVS
ncbi:MAG: EamA family transporter, partial [Candidatus Velthaea sp.]